MTRIPGRKSKGVAGILAGVILFAILFTAGMSFFLFQIATNHQYDQASQYSQKFQASKTTQLLSIATYPPQGKASSGTKLSAVLTNVGGNSSTIVQFFVRNQTGQVLCINPPLGSYPSCFTRIVGGSSSVNVLPSSFSMGIGGSVNITSSLASNNAGLKGCNVATVCSVNIVTSLGGVFTGSFPLPNALGVTITTTLSSTSIAPGQSVFDTAILTGASTNAGGSVTYSYFDDGDCGASGPPFTKSSLAASAVTNGVVPNSIPVPFASQGQYSWQAYYSGDKAHGDPSALSACEPLSVSQPGVCVPAPGTVCFATVAQGIGSIAFDFNSFKWYSAGACQTWGTNTLGQAPQNSCTLKDGLSSPFAVKGGSLAYTISQTGMSNSGTNLFFSVNITNADPQKRIIVLDQFTQLWFSWFCPEVLGGNGPCAPGPHGQIATTYYGLVNMTGPYFTGKGGPNERNPSLTVLPRVTLNYGQNATLFFGMQENFAGTVPGIPLCGFSVSIPYTSQITPVFIFFHGTLSGTSFGEDFPLASTLWTNIGSSC